MGRIIDSLKIRQLTNRQLLAVFNQAVNTYKLFAAYGPISTRVLSNALARDVRRWLKLKLAKSGKALTDDLLDQFLSQLIVPQGGTLGIKEEKQLINLAAGVVKTRGLLPLLKKVKRQSKLIGTLADRYPTFARKFNKHISNYCWLPVFIEGPAWTPKDFLTRLINLTTSKRYLVRRREIKNQSDSVQQRRRDLIKQVNPPLHIRRLLGYLGVYLSLRTQFGYMQGYGNYRLQKLYTEVARRARLLNKELMVLTAREIRLFLQKGVLPPRPVINARHQLAVLILKHGKESVLTGVAARQYIKRELPKTSASKQSYVSGLTVYHGHVQGTARILMTAKEIRKVRQGDILVTMMTSPDMVPILRKVKGIVTNEGALTCHAAIISRELKIPCIISTKIATSVFHDGDKIELIPETGIVKLVN
ncbi:MAG: hypothetical protein HY974_02975 [Candidatus Kerfeldbacteria bacterium]|nr:hypothetical protein [Candidatus Kerfeldbacteria bacterium]